MRATMDDIKPYIVVVIIQLIYAGLFLISKAAFDEGLSTLIFVFYRQAVATAFLLPFTIVAKWRTPPKLSFTVLLKIFVLALVGVTVAANVFSIGLKYTSGTVGSAAFIVIPVITFFLALLLRMETLVLRSSHGIAKAAGIALCLSGVVIVAFYKGLSINPFNHHHHLFHLRSAAHESPVHSKGTWIKGTFLLLFGSTALSFSLILQGLILDKECRSKLLLTTIQCSFGTFQTFVVAVVFNRDFSKWKIGFDMQLLGVVYSGLGSAVILWYLQAWCIQRKGAVFVAMSNPLGIVFTIIFGMLLFGQAIHLGSVIGAILTVAGLYSVLWGKHKENNVPNSSKENLNEQHV